MAGISIFDPDMRFILCPTCSKVSNVTAQPRSCCDVGRGTHGREAPPYFGLTRTASKAPMLTLSGEAEIQSKGATRNERPVSGLPVRQRESSLEKYSANSFSSHG